VGKDTAYFALMAAQVGWHAVPSIRSAVLAAQAPCSIHMGQARSLMDANLEITCHSLDGANLTHFTLSVVYEMLDFFRGLWKGALTTPALSPFFKGEALAQGCADWYFKWRDLNDSQREV
jgi:hypothetical protein